MTADTGLVLQTYTRQELEKDLSIVGDIINLVNAAYKTYYAGCYKGDHLRYPTIEHYLDQLGDGMPCCAYAVNEDGEQYLVATGFTGSWDHELSDSERDYVQGHTVMVDRSSLTPRLEVSFRGVAVIRGDKRHSGKGMTKILMDRLLEQTLKQRGLDLDTEVRVWIEAVDAVHGYWEKQGFTATETYNFAQGLWDYNRPLELSFMYKDIGGAK